ncbi:MAG: oligosaccharide flippase family protein [Bryobacteraceae bacterium]|nr:oligosaccharide flippase family protein [Bryobacteraceae bacterium]
MKVDFAPTAAVEKRQSETSRLYAKVLHGAAWSVVGAALWQGSVLVASVMVARLLGVEALGEFGMVQSTVGMFGVLAGMGLGLTATKYIAEFRRSQPARAGRVIGLTLLSATVAGVVTITILWCVAPQLSAGPMSAPHLTTALRAGGAVLLFNTIAGVQSGALVGFEAFGHVAWTSALRGGITLPFLYIGLNLGGVGGALIGQAIAGALGVIIAHAYLARIARRNSVRIRYTGFRDELRILWATSLPAMVGGALILPVNWVARVMIADRPDGYFNLGVFTGVIRIQEGVAYLGQTLGIALLPILASSKGTRQKTITTINHHLPWLLGCCITLPLVCFPEILGMILGPNFDSAQARRAFIFSSFCACILLFKQGTARELIAQEKMWLGAVANGTIALTALIAAHFLASRGAEGLAMAFLASQVMSLLVFMPIYIHHGLAPRELLLSIRSLFIWGVLVGAAIASHCHPGTAFRVVIVFLAAGLLAGAFLLDDADDKLQRSIL